MGRQAHLHLLSVGMHTLTVVYNDGECSTEFALMAAASHTHTFMWVVDKEATATEKGSKHEECSVCGYKKAAVEIPATAPTAGSGNITAPKTGDDSNPMAWVALLFISGGILTGVTVLRRKKNSL